jgi:hypothetical protein
MDRRKASFPHKLNADGSFDSICPMCFRTVATAAQETELAALERKHQCDPEAVTVNQILGRERRGK